MELQAHKADLVRELALAQGIVEKKNTIPILSNVLLKASKGWLLLQATDLEIGIRHGLKAEVSQAGELTVSAKKLFEIVRSLPEDAVTLSSREGGRLRVCCGKSEFKIVALDAKDFPALPECDFTSSFELPAGLFNRLIAKVLFAVTTDESRFPLAGALFIGNDKGVQLVATDGHRLAWAEIHKGVKGMGAEQRFVIPKKALVELRRALELGCDTVAIQNKDNHLFFRLGDRVIISRAVDDQFPVYEKVIPRSNDKKLSFTKIELEGAVRRVALLAAEKAGAVKLSFAPGRLVVSSSNPEMGEAVDEIACSFLGEPFEIGFNAQYLVEFLGVLETERVSFELKDGVTQGLLRPEGGSDEVTHQYVIMPMRI